MARASNETLAAPVEQPLDRKEVARLLKYVIDPEVGINIVDLGLVYDLRLEGERASLTLTMTTPACPMSRYIMQQSEMVLSRIRGIFDVDVDLVWQPPWSPAMIEPEVRERMFGSRGFRRSR